MVAKSKSSSFFLSGECKDPGYRNVRDLPHFETYHYFVEDLWRDYRPYADRHFLNEARNQFLQRFWEMYLCVVFLRRGFLVTKISNEGPEFVISIEDRRIWIEAIAPNSGTGPDYVPEPPYDGYAFDVPTEKIILRYTNALSTKLVAYNKYFQKGLIKEKDSYVVAINSRGIPHAPYGSVLPYHVHAFLPFGPLSACLDRKTLMITDSFFQHREHVKKQNDELISTQPFLDPTYAGISAVIHSAVDCANGPGELGADFDILHNPLAECALPLQSLNWCRNRIYSKGILHTIEPNRED